MIGHDRLRSRRIAYARHEIHYRHRGRVNVSRKGFSPQAAEERAHIANQQIGRLYRREVAAALEI